MKKTYATFVLFVLCSLCSQLLAQTVLSKADRQKAVNSLKSSHVSLKNMVKGLSSEQLNFKANPDSWSIAECVEHIASSEKALFGLAQSTLQAEADPSKRSEINMSDEQVVQLIVDRSSKVKTRPDLEPKNNYGSLTGSLTEFKALRKNSIKYIKKTQDDLRNHYFDFPFGKVDTYQIIMFMSGHTTRHTNQIQEIMEHGDFPKS